MFRQGEETCKITHQQGTHYHISKEPFTTLVGMPHSKQTACIFDNCLPQRCRCVLSFMGDDRMVQDFQQLDMMYVMQVSKLSFSYLCCYSHRGLTFSRLALPQIFMTARLWPLEHAPNLHVLTLKGNWMSLQTVSASAVYMQVHLVTSIVNLYLCVAACSIPQLSSSQYKHSS